MSQQQWLPNGATRLIRQAHNNDSLSATLNNSHTRETVWLIHQRRLMAGAFHPLSKCPIRVHPRSLTAEEQLTGVVEVVRTRLMDERGGLRTRR